jgi:hypothetical protein
MFADTIIEGVTLDFRGGNVLFVLRSMIEHKRCYQYQKVCTCDLILNTHGTRGRACGFVELAPGNEAESPDLYSEGGREVVHTGPVVKRTSLINGVQVPPKGAKVFQQSFIKLLINLSWRRC